MEFSFVARGFMKYQAEPQSIPGHQPGLVLAKRMQRLCAQYGLVLKTILGLSLH